MENLSKYRRVLDVALKLKTELEKRVPAKYVSLIPYIAVVAVGFYSSERIDLEGKERAAAVKNEAIHRDRANAQLAYEADLRACARGNDLRQSLRVIVRANEPSLRKYHKEGLLNDSQYKRALVNQKVTMQRLADVDCKSVIKIASVK